MMDGLLSMMIYIDLLWTICCGKFTGSNQYLTLDRMTPDDTSILKFETLRVVEKCDMVSLMRKGVKEVLAPNLHLESQQNCWSLWCCATSVGKIWSLSKWRCPKMGVLLVIIHWIVDGIFCEASFLGSHMAMETSKSLVITINHHSSSFIITNHH